MTTLRPGGILAMWLFVAAGVGMPAAALGANACSPSVGKVNLNEYNYIDHFTEIKKLDAGVNMTGWKATVYTSNKTTSGALPASGANSCDGGVYQVSQFSANETSQNADIVLFDNNNDVVDILRVRTANTPFTTTYYPSSIPGCSFVSSPYDLQVSAANKGVDRSPDGSGPWRNTPGTGSGSYSTQCAGNAGSGATPAGFNAFESATAAGSVTGVIKTKVAASAFNLDVVALKSGGTAVETAFAGDVKLELVDASVGASCGAYALIRNLGTLTFAAANQGRKTQAGINESNAWPNVRVRMTYPAAGTPTVVTCSTDNFAIRPASLAGIIVSDLNSTTSGTARTLYNTGATGGNVHKAGQPFRIAATAQNAAGAATANYTGNPAASLTACVLPSTGCTLGVLTTGAWMATSGTVVAAGASYSEVGAFTMKLVDANFAAVDAADGSTAAERNIESIAFNVGRFVPDHFVLATASTPVFKTFNDTTCATRSFTYVGQPFGYLPSALPQATITAKNAAGGTTLNYAGALWKVLPADVTQTYTPAPATLDDGLVGLPVVTSTGSGTGTMSANVDDVLAYVRSTPIAEFNAVIDLSISVTDSAENAIAGNGTINSATPALFSSIAFDSGNLIRFGRLALSNAQGSELLGLPVPIETQFWNATGFSRNTADHCTMLTQNHAALSNWQPNLNACETSVTLAGRFNAGRGNLRLSAPGVNNTGSVDLRLNLGAVGAGTTCVGGAASPVAGASQSWLQVKGSGTAYDQDPVARASFGLFRGSKPLIYMRERY